MTRRALLIGNQHYGPDSGLTDLPAVEHDLRLMYAVLSERGQFDDIDVLKDVPRQGMIRRIGDFYSGARSSDTLLLYFSGHGLTSSDEKMFFLAGCDAEVAYPQTGGLNTGSELWTCLHETRAGQRLVLLDCCFSGAVGDTYRVRGPARASIGKLRQARGTFIITASGRYQTAREHAKPGQPSVFTGAVVEALRGDKVGHDENGWVTARDLSEYVQREVPRAGKGQTPNEFSEGVTGPIQVALSADQTEARSPASTSRPAAGRGPGGAHDPVTAPLDTGHWQRLMNYYIACMQGEARLGSFVPAAETSRYRLAPAGPELVFAGTSGRVSVDVHALAAKHEPLLYGYPTIVESRGSGKHRRPHLTPLLLVEVTPDASGDLTATWPPQVNPVLMDEAELDEPEQEQLTSLVESHLTRGDHRSLRDVASRMLTVLGIDASAPVDPHRLEDVLRAGPSTRHVRNVGMFYRPDLAQTTLNGLIQDFTKQLRPNTAAFAGTALVGLAGPGPEDQRDVTIVAPDRLNEAQEQVVRAAMTRRLTVAQGPPGTGKSQLVGAVIATATAMGESVVLASTNNQPVDDVVSRANTIAPGLVMRTGNKQKREEEPRTLTDLIARYGRHPAPAGDQVATAYGQLRAIAGEIHRARTELAEREEIEADLADLAAQRSEQPPVVAGFELPTTDIELGQLVRRADMAARYRIRGWWHRRSFRRIGIGTVGDLLDLAVRAATELHWRERVAAEARLRPEHDPWRQLAVMADQHRPVASRSLVGEQVRRRIVDGRMLLEQRREALQNKKSWSRFAPLLKALPGWATSTYSTSTIKPDAGLFDLVVIDEAAQCGIAHILPLLYRAKRALIIGDPQQLQPVVQLPAKEEKTYRARAGLGDAWMDERHLSYADGTAYAAAAAVETPFLLNEHYRCHPDIAAVPNRRLYDGKLTVLTDLRTLAVKGEPAVQWIDQQGEVTQPQGRSAVNEREAQAVATQVAELRARHPQASIGIVTPFRAQTHRINTLLEERELPERAGTVHRLQGSERDIIVLSPVGSARITSSSRRWLLTEQTLWNVAITRAKGLLVVVGDRDWWEAEPNMLADLAANADHLAGEYHHSPATDAIGTAILRAGLTAERNGQLAGQSCDFLLSLGREKVGLVIDSPGTGDGRHLRQQLSTLSAAARSGSRVIRVPAWRALTDPDAVICAVRPTSTAPDRGQ